MDVYIHFRTDEVFYSHIPLVLITMTTRWQRVIVEEFMRA